MPDDPSSTNLAPGEASFDVLAIGNALVDVLASATDEFLAERGLAKGGMALIDAATSADLYAAMGPGVESSGGSAGNTVVGVAGLGGRAKFIGRVNEDQLGEVFRHDIRAAGVAFDQSPSAEGSPTGRCLVLVTPDAERTLNTFLGAAAEIGPADIDPAELARAEVVFLEGYLWDPLPAREALVVAADAARRAGRKVAFTLSDSFLVDRYGPALKEFVEQFVDILFANESEARMLTGAENAPIEDVVAAIAPLAEIVAVTRSEYGSIVVTDSGAERHHVMAEPVNVVDTTGAGDAYAAGFLFGFTKGFDLDRCGRLGARCAGSVIADVGGRPQEDLKALCADLL